MKNAKSGKTYKSPIRKLALFLKKAETTGKENTKRQKNSSLFKR